MNSRCVLLVAVMLLFTRVWTAAQRKPSPSLTGASRAVPHSRGTPQPGSAPCGSSQVRSLLPRVDLGEPAARPTPVTDPPLTPAPRWIPQTTRGVESRGTFVTVSNQESDQAWDIAPLPEGITPGTYRVVDNRGCVSRVEIHPHEVPAPTAAQTADGTSTDSQVEPPDFYVMSLGSARWYFIRLDVTREQHPSPPGKELIVQQKPSTPDLAPQAETRTVSTSTATPDVALPDVPVTEVAATGGAVSESVTLPSTPVESSTIPNPDSPADAPSAVKLWGQQSWTRLQQWSFVAADWLRQHGQTAERLRSPTAGSRN